MGMPPIDPTSRISRFLLQDRRGSFRLQEGFELGSFILSMALEILAGNIPTAPAYAHAKAAAWKAIHLNDKLAEAHRDLGWLLFSDDGDVRGAENEYRRALQLNPSDAHTQHWYAQLLIAERRKDEALGSTPWPRLETWRAPRRWSITWKQSPNQDPGCPHPI
jgi:tetratricopeptide (TPR) repeat protein